MVSNGNLSNKYCLSSLLYMSIVQKVHLLYCFMHYMKLNTHSTCIPMFTSCRWVQVASCVIFGAICPGLHRLQKKKNK